MLNLTREAIELHRKMWNWIADESIRQKRKVREKDYFYTMQISEEEQPLLDSYACEYAVEKSRKIKYCGSCCKYCPINWGGDDNDCLNDESLFTKWSSCGKSDYEEAARLAREIANLLEREVK